MTISFKETLELSQKIIKKYSKNGEKTRENASNTIVSRILG